MKWMFIAWLAVSSFSPLLYAELTPLDSKQLGGFYGQFELPVKNRSVAVGGNSHETTEAADSRFLLGLDSSDLQLTQGIELDLSIQTSFDFEYIDTDGLGDEDSEGSLFLSGVHIGSSKSPLTSGQIQSDQPFQESDLALVNNILIDVDPKAGMFVTIEEIGDNLGNGIDIVVNDIYLGNKESSAGSFIIEDVSNFIQDVDVEKNNQLFAMNLATLDDGKQTANGNWVPFYSKILPIEGQNTAEVGFVDSVIPPTEDLGFPSVSANTIIDASFVLNIDKVAWVDDGNEFGLAGVMVYQGIDTNNDGIDDTIGPARLTQMKLETVDHKTIDGTDVKALYIENLDFKADIAIQSIYVGTPEQSLGALHIKGLDTSGTSLWIYPH